MKKLLIAIILVCVSMFSFESLSLKASNASSLLSQKAKSTGDFLYSNEWNTVLNKLKTYDNNVKINSSNFKVGIGSSVSNYSAQLNVLTSSDTDTPMDGLHVEVAKALGLDKWAAVFSNLNESGNGMKIRIGNSLGNASPAKLALSVVEVNKNNTAGSSIMSLTRGGVFSLGYGTVPATALSSDKLLLNGGM